MKHLSTTYMKRLAIILALFFSLNLHAQTIKVAAAGNLLYILKEIKSAYEQQYPGTSVLITMGSSGTLTQQIMNGASFDVFMAADKVFPEKLKAEGFTSGEVKTYAYGKLVLWSKTIDLRTRGLSVLLDPAVVHLAIARPEVAPYGERAIQCLRYYKLLDKVRPKFVFGDNIAQAAQFAETANAEAAFVALSLLYGEDVKNKGFSYIPDRKSYQPVAQAMVCLKNAADKVVAAKFMNYVLSKKCKAAFERYGYSVK